MAELDETLRKCRYCEFETRGSLKQHFINEHADTEPARPAAPTEGQKMPAPTL